MIPKRPVFSLKRLAPECTEILGWTGGFLRQRGASGFIVGGLLRDSLLGVPQPDIDIVVSGIEPGKVADHLHRRHGFSRPVVFRRFKTTLTVKKGSKVEICALRRDIQSDACLRDFTLNCLYVNLVSLISSGSAGVLDPTRRGISDLKNGVLATPGDAHDTLWADPIRILRGVRFHATLGLKIDRQVRDPMRRLVYLLTRVSVERVRTELEKILTSRRLRSSFRLMQRTGIIDVILPEVGRTYGFSQATPYHAYDLFTHLVRTTANTPPDLVLRLAGLLHDLGKPETRLDRGERAVYYGHEEVSAEVARSVLMRLRFPKRVTEQVYFLVRNHMINYSRHWSDRAIRRFSRKMGGSLENILALVEADMKAQRPDPGMAAKVRELRSRIRALYEQGEMHLDLPVDGHTIMRILGIREGPAVGIAKDFLLDQASRRTKPLTRAQCLRLLRRWASVPGRTSAIDVDKVRLP